MWRVVLAAVASAALFPASAAADNTPAGPATLLYRWTGPMTLEGRPPEVLTAAEVVVGEGGKAGTIRIRAGYGKAMAVGEPVVLPGEPGAYLFPAPHIRWDYRGSRIGFDQETGEHAVLSQKTCDPSNGEWVDPCNLERVDVWTPPGAEGEPTQVMKGAKLAVRGIFEPDVDEDLAGDKSEDRTDLKVSAVPSRDEDGRLRIAVTITNAGPRAADMPIVAGSDVKAQDECRFRTFAPTLGGNCLLSKPIAVGETRTVDLVSDSPDAITTTINVRSEGADLADGDNTVKVSAPAATPFRLTCAKVHKGVKVEVRGVRDGQARVTLSLRGGKVKLAKVVTLKAGKARELTFRPAGAKLRALRRAHKRSLPATVTVRASGVDPVTTKTTVRL